MSKATCEPDRKSKLIRVCEICGLEGGEAWQYSFLAVQSTPEATKARAANAKNIYQPCPFNKDRDEPLQESIQVVCMQCLRKVLAFIEERRDSEHYYKTCHERLLEKEGRPSESEQLLITDERGEKVKESLYIFVGSGSVYDQ